MSSKQSATYSEVVIENLREEDLAAADQVFRLAFGTFIGIPDPLEFAAGADFIKTRWKTDPEAFFAAKVDGQLAGTNFATNRGTVGFFGPLTIHPSYWDRGIGKRLMEPVMDSFSKWGTTHEGLFTFAQSQKHVGLYQRFGFWPRFLTAIMGVPVRKDNQAAATKFSELSSDDRKKAIGACNELTDKIYPGMSAASELLGVFDQKLGDTLLIGKDLKLEGFAVCHCGPGSEAGPATCHVKFGAVASNENSVKNFSLLLDACEALAAQRGLTKLTAGVNTARIEAYQIMLKRGFKTELQGVTMHRPNQAGYSRPGAYVIDDWR
ncbi:MAG TPA: GNAT family N-acetyltransferase [Pyrinomonadaceae bacterium]|nr:GNAT family N-acetyltransferase [Pyrinomonadaceae bacterium]